jgi:D-alanyl-D-alanine carboxypeptidase/D-alanyl-D-alanine-endopeptidase (penicillin-binding protein 4)
MRAMKRLLPALLLVMLAACRREEPPRAEPAAPAPPVEIPKPPVVAPAPVPPPSRFAEIEAMLDAAGENAALAGAAIGLCLLDEKGEIVVNHRAETAFIPASSLKTVTTATALEVLGPEFRFTTELRATAKMEDGVIAGDLVIVGGGDPMLKPDDLAAMVTQLKAQGLLRITGTVRGDGGLFPGSIYNDFWNWGDIGNGFGSGVSGLNLNHNRFSGWFRAGDTVGAAATFLGTRPDVPDVLWKNEVVTGAADSGDGVMIHGGEKTPVVHLRGTVPLGAQEFHVKGAVPDPVRFTEHHLRRSLLDAGIEVGTSNAGSLETAHLLVKHESPPLMEIIKSIHATSDNHETECVFLTLGLKAGKPPVEVIRSHWAARGLAFTGLRMEDGCGLARADFVRPADLARLQFLAGKGPQGEAYKASLLSRGGLRWKGGAMSGVRTFTGYATTEGGEEFSYALMVNHYTDGKAVSAFCQTVLDSLLKLPGSSPE